MPAASRAANTFQVGCGSARSKSYRSDRVRAPEHIALGADPDIAKVHAGGQARSSHRHRGFSRPKSHYVGPLREVTSRRGDDTDRSFVNARNQGHRGSHHFIEDVVDVVLGLRGLRAHLAGEVVLTGCGPVILSRRLALRAQVTSFTS